MAKSKTTYFHSGVETSGEIPQKVMKKMKMIRNENGDCSLSWPFHIRVRVFVKYNFRLDAVNNPPKIIFKKAQSKNLL
jgi:hypothetical protein